MAKEIEKRPASAAAFAAELRQMATTLDARAGETPRPSSCQLNDDREVGAVWGAVAGVAVIAAVLWWALK